MKSDIHNKIHKIVSGSIEESKVVHLMVLIRKYLEKTDTAETDNFFTLKFFCDWSLHSSISRSLPAMELLKEVNKVILELKSIPDNKLIIDAVTKIVSFQKLRAELKNFFAYIDESDLTLLGEHKWGAFVNCFTQIVLDCPLVLSNPKDYKKAKPIYDHIIANPIKEGAWVIGFSLSDINNKFFEGTNKPSHYSTLSLILYTSNTTRIVIPQSKNFLS